MWGEFEFLKRETLTETAQKFKFPQYKLRALWESSGAFNRNLDGIYAKWNIVTPDDSLDADFVSVEARAKPAELSPRGHQSVRMQTSFHDKHFPAEIMGNYENAEGIVADELMFMRKTKGDVVDEYMLAGMLQDSIVVSVDGVSQTYTPGIPAGNKKTASTAWSDATADVMGDVGYVQEAIENYGYVGAIALASRSVLDAMRKNTVVKDYLANMGLGVDVLGKGEIPGLFGLRWIRYDQTYNSSGSRARFLTQGKVIIIPVPSREWTEFQVGKAAIGGTESLETAGMPSFPMRNEYVAWAVKETNPPGFTLYGRYHRLPVLKVPQAVGIITTGIT